MQQTEDDYYRSEYNMETTSRRTVQVRADDTATKIRNLVEGTRLTYDGFEKPGSQRGSEKFAAAQRKLYEDEYVVKMVEHVMDFYTEHPIDPDVLASHDSQWYKQSLMRVTSKHVSTGAVIVGLQLLEYTLRGKRHELTEHAEFYAPGARPAEAVYEVQPVSYGAAKDEAIKKANRRRKKREKDAKQRELEEVERQLATLTARRNALYKEVHGKEPSKAALMDDAHSQAWLLRGHDFMVAAGCFTGRHALARVDAYLCRHAKVNVPVSKGARTDWTVEVPTAQATAAALHLDESNTARLYRDLVRLGRLEVHGGKHRMVTFEDEQWMRDRLREAERPATRAAKDAAATVLDEFERDASISDLAEVHAL